MEFSLTKIGDIADFINGHAFKPTDWIDDDNGYKIIRIQNLTDSSKPFNRTRKEVPKKYLVKKGDVLVSWSATIDVFIWDDEPSLLNQHIFKVDFDHSKIYDLYFVSVLKDTIRELTRHAHGSTMKHVTKKDFVKHRIPLPSLDDQIRIAKVLGNVEELIKQREKSIALADEFLKMKFLEMFGDPARNTKGFDREFLTEFGEIITGNTPSRRNKEFYSEHYIEWIKTGNIEEDVVYATRAEEYLSESGAEAGRYVDPGALLVTCIAGSEKSIGRVALVDRKVCFNQQINAIQPFPDVSSLFLYWLFRVGRSYIQSMATKGMKKIITKGEFSKVTLPKPPIDLQNQFASIVQQTEKLKEYYQQSLDELNNLYGSLSQRAFKGELDVSGVEVEEELINVERKESAPYLTKDELENPDQGDKKLRKEINTQIIINSMEALRRHELKDSFDSFIDQKYKEKGYSSNTAFFLTLANMSSVLSDIDTPFIGDPENATLERVIDRLRARKEPFSFEEFWKLVNSTVNDEIKYEDIKEVVFTWLSAPHPWLSQVFDENEKQMKLTASILHETPQA